MTRHLVADAPPGYAGWNGYYRVCALPQTQRILLEVGAPDDTQRSIALSPEHALHLAGVLLRQVSTLLPEHPPTPAQDQTPG